MLLLLSANPKIVIVIVRQSDNCYCCCPPIGKVSLLLLQTWQLTSQMMVAIFINRKDIPLAEQLTLQCVVDDIMGEIINMASKMVILLKTKNEKGGLIKGFPTF